MCDCSNQNELNEAKQFQYHHHIRLINCQPQALQNIKHIKHIQWQWQYKKSYITKRRRTQNSCGLGTLLILFCCYVRLILVVLSLR